jgi:hypothetical protein
MMREPVAGLTCRHWRWVGAIQHAAKAGVATATGVEASTAYLAVAREEPHASMPSALPSPRQFCRHRRYAPPADIVTLDRAIRRYHDMPTLVDRSSAGRALVWASPRDTWWVRAPAYAPKG